MLFIDSNAFLEFYNSSQDKLKKLLPTLEEICDEIFVTQQVSFEVKRNRLKVVALSLNNYLTGCSIKGIKLPEHLDEQQKKEIVIWNKSFADCSDQIKEVKNNLQELIEKILYNVQNGNDTVSIILDKIFTNAILPSIDEINLAKRRKDIGNPPGKKSDPLGDEINWEQILSRYTGETPLWIISADGDYSSVVNKKRYLNSFLYNEIYEKTKKKVEVYVFDSIAEGVQDYCDKRPTAPSNMPTKTDIEEISKQEELNRYSYIDHGISFVPKKCMNCDYSGELSGPYPKPSRYGGWSYQWSCPKCGHLHDYGEPYGD